MLIAMDAIIQGGKIIVFSTTHSHRCKKLQTIDPLLYSPETLLQQAATAQEHLGYKIIQFYVDQRGLLSSVPTDESAVFYYSPSGGTLRDGHLNIVLYSAKFDMYKGLGRL